MAKIIDLTGKQFGKLTVLERTVSSQYGRALWLCRCECGRKKIVRSDYLIRGRTIHCDCDLEKLPATALVDKRFGKLTVIGTVSSGKSIKLLCLCDCGYKRVVRKCDLTIGRIASCAYCSGEKVIEARNMRRCHDCGRPTYNYRCDACWEKIRRHTEGAEEGSMQTEEDYAD